MAAHSPQEEQVSPDERVGLLTLVNYWLLRRDAILRLAAAPRGTLTVGLLFVLAAGFAREYDGEYLWAEPWHLAIPLVASVASSLILYLLLFGVGHWRGARAPFVKGYAVFLGLYWWTAPLAWLYAIPVERIFTAPQSVQANLWFLALVAAWRVLIMVRVARVLWDASTLSAATIVLLFGASLVLGILAFTELPLVSLMGGIRLTESEQILAGTAFLVRLVCFLSLFPLGLIFAIDCLPRLSSWQWYEPTKATSPLSWSMWTLAIGGLVLGLVILPGPQAEQKHRWQVEQLFRQGEAESALAYMSQREVGDFPPHWDPPPRVGFGQHEPDLLKVLMSLQKTHQQATAPTAAWVEQRYSEKLLATITPFYTRHPLAIVPDELSQAELERFAKYLNRQPAATRAAVAKACHRELRDLLFSPRVNSLSDQRLELLYDMYCDGTESNQTAEDVAADATRGLELQWQDRMLHVTGEFPGGDIPIYYLEAYCRPGSTDRDWGETVIKHQSRLGWASDDQRVVRLHDRLADGVQVVHTLLASEQRVHFYLEAHNPTEEESDVSWAQPCVRVGAFTGCATDDARELYPDYIRKCFLYINGRRTMLPTSPWAQEARYTPGQVYCPQSVDRNDVNPRPLSSLVPSSPWCGCFSENDTHVLAMKWEPYQEIFQGVITCLHNDFRVGGLAPGETKPIQGEMLILPHDTWERQESQLQRAKEL